MSLWWLEPGWGDATCAVCGVNIQSTGGDPDWGLCWPHMQDSVERHEREREMFAATEKAEREYYAELERTTRSDSEKEQR
jgi:hypothetical protein